MKDVMIKIKGTQGIDGDTDVVEFDTLGCLEETKDGIRLSYEEGEMIGSSGIHTVLTASQDNVVLERTGELSSKLVITKNARNNCFYSTPQGDLVIGIFGETVKNGLSSDGGKLEMSYTIDSNLQLISRNSVEITVREVEKNVPYCC